MTQVNTPNIIPGTNLVASPGAKSAFAEYLDGKAEREAQRSAEQVVENVQKIAKDKAPKAEKTPKVNDKKVAAKRIFDANKDKGNGEIAQLIASELEITYANAYYYVTRAFKR